MAGWFILAVLAFYPEIVLPTRILADYDVWTYFYPLRSYAAEAIRAGRFPLWNPDTFMGAPFFANPQTSLLYPGTILFYLIWVPYAFSLSVLLHVWLCAVGTYLLLRRSIQVGVTAALAGAAAFAFGGFVSSQVGHINQLGATAWMPLIVLSADLAQRKRSLRWALIGGFAFAIQLLAGHAQESYMTLWVVLVVLAWRVTDHLKRVPATEPPEEVGLRSTRRGLLQSESRLGETLPPLVRAAAAAGLALFGTVLVGFGLAAVQLLPTVELSAESIRGGGMTFGEATSFSLIPPLVVRALLPGYWFNLFGEYFGYVGAIGLGFAALALLCGRLRPTILGATLALLGIFLALGAGNPVYPLLFDLVPGIDFFRVPARWLLVYSVGAAILVAVGIDWVFDRARARPGRTRLVSIGIFLAGLLLVAMPFTREVPLRILALWLMGFVTAAALASAAMRWPTRPLAIAVLVLALIELRLAAMQFPVRHSVPEEAATVTRPVPAYLQTLGAGRILSIAPTEYEVDDGVALAKRFPDLDERTMFDFKSALKLDEVMSPNVPLRYDLSTVDGYDGGVLPLRRYLEVASLLVPPGELRSDGVIRTRLIAVPDRRLWEFFDLGAVIANKVRNVELEGIRFDVATARELTAGSTVRVELPAPVRARELAMLGSLGASPAPGAELAGAVLFGTDGSRVRFALRAGEQLFFELEPGTVSTPQPTAGLSRGDRRDSMARVVVEEPPLVNQVEFTWHGQDTWSLRGATLLDEEGRSIPLLLQPRLRVREFATLNVFERDPPEGVRLIPRAEVMDDAVAIVAIRNATEEELAGKVWLAADGQQPGPTSGSPSEALFRERSGLPEQRTFVRESGIGGGYLVIPDAWFPGWRASVDGAESPVLRANVLLKAVWVPEGAQSVELSYDPRSIKVGLAITLFTAFTAALAWWRART